MDPFDRSEQDTTRYSMFHVLADVANTLQKSKYANHYTLKGGLALMSALYTNRRTELLRATTDIDLDYRSLEMWEQFVQEAQMLLTDNSVYGFQYELKSRRESNPTNSDSLSFNAVYKDEIFQFKIDMNIKQSENTAVYNIPQLSTALKAGKLEYMLTDKLNVLGQKKVCRRIKDLYDVYVIAQLKEFTLDELKKEWEANTSCLAHNIIPIFIFDPNNINMLEHSYDKFYGIEDKPDFNTVYKGVTDFTTAIYEAILYNVDNKKWDINKKIWW